MRNIDTETLKKDKEFRRVYSKGRSFANRELVIYILNNNTDNNRLGISVSKKVGNAVTRNRVKRLIKEVYRVEYKGKLKVGYDIVVLGRINAANCSYDRIKGSLGHLFKKVGLASR